MVEIAHSIDRGLARKLRDQDFRRRFFLAEASAKIAQQILTLRKKRGATQAEVAKMVGTGQPAISRAEQADYENWSLRTLRGIADALDARLRVIIEPSEDVLAEYEALAPHSSQERNASEPQGMPKSKGVGIDLPSFADASKDFPMQRGLHDGPRARDVDISEELKRRSVLPSVHG